MRNESEKYDEIYVAGGCFWGTEKYFGLLNGVISTDVGYANGTKEAPTYQEVCSQNVGFAETVHIVYDKEQVTLSHLLDMYSKVIDPVSVNRQGADKGIQYRTGIYYKNDIDKPVILEFLDQLSKQYQEPIAIECKPLENYYKAEEYHQKYLDKNPGGYCHIGDEVFKNAKDARSASCCNKFEKPNQEILQKMLSHEQYEVTQHSATEPPYQNEYWNFYEPGIYVDITTGEPMFVSTDKFNSGCGWPSFSKPLSPALIIELPDDSLGRHRTEVRSKKGDAHLGHVFEDGKEELGGLRYCINSASLRFIPRDSMEKEGYQDYLRFVK